MCNRIHYRDGKISVRRQLGRKLISSSIVFLIPEHRWRLCEYFSREPNFWRGHTGAPWYIPRRFAPGQHTRNHCSRRSRFSRGRRGSIETVVSDARKTLTRKFIGYSEMNSAAVDRACIFMDFVSSVCLRGSGHPMKNSCGQNRPLILQLWHSREKKLFSYFRLFQFISSWINTYVIIESSSLI